MTNIGTHANHFIAIAETLLAGVMLPPIRVDETLRRHPRTRRGPPAVAPSSNSRTPAKNQSVAGFCEQEIERALNQRDWQHEVSSLILELSSCGCDGLRLLSCLLAARFHEVVGRYADVFLDSLIHHNEHVAFEVNNFTYCRAGMYGSTVVPLRFACLDGYKEALHDLGRAVPRGQSFGL
jgi:hypothetical protein